MLASEMQEDSQTYFAQELNDIVVRWIPSSFGQIYSVTAGNPGQPLILIVHGSGPKNSSDQYIQLLQQYLVRVSYIQKFYLVAIDCPGYGRSQGSKEAVKTFPLRMYRDILASLRYQSYYALFGHSQGGASIFNAVYEEPTIAQFLVMDRPVCGNIQRFRGFAMPTLLIYDIEDDGHPIWQGKLLFKQLKNSKFLTYRNSQDPYWVPDNIWNKMLEFFASNSSKYTRVPKFKEDKKRNKSEDNVRRQSSLIARPYVSQSKQQEMISTEKISQQMIEIEEVQKSELLSLSTPEEERSAMLEDQNSQQKSIKSSQQKRQKEGSLVQKLNVLLSGKADTSNHENIQKNGKEKQIKLTTHIQQAEKPNLPANQLSSIRLTTDQLWPIKTTLEQQRHQTHPINIVRPPPTEKQAEMLHLQNRCAICVQSYYRPVMTNCKHIFCNKCITEALLVSEKCPLCRAKIVKKTQQEALHKETIALMSEQEQLNRQNAYRRLQTMLSSIVKIEVGNNSTLLQTKQSIFTTTKKKYNWQLYVKEPKNFAIEQVTFNINMGQATSKPIRVKSKPFVFESRGTFSFSCQIGIKPKSKQYADLIVVYRIEVEPGNHYKIVSLKKKFFG